MSNKFQAIGNFVYEKGERIGTTVEEASDRLACKLNAYQMRVERFKLENASLKAEVERLKEGNDCLGQMHDKEMERSAYLLEEFNRTTAWGRGLESDLSHARVEISFLKAEVERLRASSFVTAVPVEQYERLRKAGDELVLCINLNSAFSGNALRSWLAAKEGKQS